MSVVDKKKIEGLYDYWTMSMYSYGHDELGWLYNN